jgi:translocator protein
MDFALLGFVAVNVLVAMSGAVFKPGDWYESLDRPDWRPPNWAFPVVWTLLYAMIAAAGWLAWREAGGFGGAPVAFLLYAAQLALNAAWSWLFFGRKRPDLALMEMAALWLAILANALAFHAVTPLAGWLLVPYLAWVTVAFALNLSILRRNPQTWRRGA